jgi:hypothetical protein
MSAPLPSASHSQQMATHAAQSLEQKKQRHLKYHIYLFLHYVMKPLSSAYINKEDDTKRTMKETRKCVGPFHDYAGIHMEGLKIP